jgi:hypothetical protein
VKSRTTIVLSALAVAAALAAGSADGAGRACPTTNAPNELVLTGGSGQTARLGRQFQTSFQVALANTNGCPLTGNLAGVSVEFDAPSSGASGIFSSSGSRIAVVGTDAQGVAVAPPFTANYSAGSYSVDAHSSYGSVSFSLDNTATGVPAAIAATAGSPQETAVNSPYGQQLQARVTDANGSPVQGATVTFAIVPGPTGAGASFIGGAPSAETDSNGVAISPPLLANGAPGRFAATASTGGVSAVATYALDNHAAAMTVASVGSAGPSATVGTRYRQPLQARVVDAAGQPVEGASVSFTITPSDRGAGASFLGGAAQATALTGPDGTASSPPLVANKTAGAFTATATASGGAAPAAYALVNLAAAPSAVTAGAASGQSAVVGSRFAVPLAVTVLDENGNPVRGAVVTFAAPKRGPSGRFAHGLRRVRVTTNDKGIAIAPPFTANAIAGGYAVTATIAGTAKRAAFALANRSR